MTVQHLVFESYGVLLEVELPDEFLPAVYEVLPPGWAPSPAFPEDGHFTVVPAGEDGLYQLFIEAVKFGTNMSFSTVLHVLGAQLRARVAYVSPDRIFVHSGVVAVGERAILLPGLSFTGKTALVAAMVSAGATYLSDEFAVLDADGLVHPFPKPLSIRIGEQRRGSRTSVEQLGGEAGDRPLVPALIASLTYQPGAEWNPRVLAPGAGALALLANTIPAKSRPAQTLAAVGKAAQRAAVLEGGRGEADVTAKLLLAHLAQQPS